MIACNLRLESKFYITKNDSKLVTITHKKKISLKNKGKKIETLQYLVILSIFVAHEKDIAQFCNYFL